MCVLVVVVVLLVLVRVLVLVLLLAVLVGGCVEKCVGEWVGWTATRHPPCTARRLVLPRAAPLLLHAFRLPHRRLSADALPSAV